MYLLRKTAQWIRLPLADKSHLVEAIGLLWAIRLTLWIRPYHTWRGWLRQPRVNGDHPLTDHQVNRLMWAIAAMSRVVPKATCLTQALVAQRMLAQRGQPSELKIGVALSTREAKPAIHAHAWVVVRDRVVIGNQRNLSQFKILPISDHLMF